MTVAPQADTEVVTGIVQGVVAKAADKWQVEVNIGQQNPRRLWTKDADLVSVMMGMIGQTLAFQCGVSQWTNSQNQPVRSLWINGYGAPGAQAAPTIPQPPMPQAQVPQYQAPQPVPTMQQPVQAQPVTQDVREDRIHRQTASKVAAILLTHIEPEKRTLPNLISISERLVHYYEHGVQWGGDQGNPSGPAVQDGDPGPQGAPHTDDDIPF